MKYTIVTISGIHTQIALKTHVEGYTVGVLESMLLEDEEMDNMSDKEIDEWISENNKRMTAICKFLNENNL